MKYNNFRSPLGREPETVREFFRANVRIYGDKPLFMQKEDGKYISYSYKGFMDDVNALGTELVSRGFGGKKMIVMGENRYAWVLAYMTAVCGAGVIVPIDKELAAEELANIAELSEAAVIFYSEGCAAKAEALPESVAKISFGELDGLVKEGANKRDGSFEQAEIDPDEMAVLLFTSGTTGVSKGVMLSNRNICSMLYQATALVDMNENDVLLSVLPLHHTYECSCGFLAPLYVGATVAFCEGLRQIMKNLREVRPTLLICVPILAETMYKKIKSDIARRKLEGKAKLGVEATNLLGSGALAMAAKKRLFGEYTPRSAADCA